MFFSLFFPDQIDETEIQQSDNEQKYTEQPT